VGPTLIGASRKYMPHIFAAVSQQIQPSPILVHLVKAGCVIHCTVFLLQIFMCGLPYYWANWIIDWLFLYPLDIFLYMEFWENKWNEMFFYWSLHWPFLTGFLTRFVYLTLSFQPAVWASYHTLLYFSFIIILCDLHKWRSSLLFSILCGSINSS